MCQSNLTRDAKQTGSYNELQQLMQIYRADVCQCERRITPGAALTTACVSRSTLSRVEVM